MTLPIDADLRTLVEHLPYYVVVIDSEARYVWANRLDPTLRREDVIGQPFDAFTPAEERAESRAVVERCLREGTSGYYEVRGYAHGGYEAWYGCRVVALPADADGRPRAMILCSDITEQYRAQRALARSEARFRCLVEGTPDFISVIDHNRRLLYISRDPPIESGLARTDILGRPIDELVDEATRAHAIAVIDRVFATGQPGSYDSADAAHTHHYHVDVMPFAEAAEPNARAMVVARDVTLAWQAARQRETMLAELDHRVKNALTTISAIAEQTMARATSLDSFRETFTGRLHSVARTHEALAASRWAAVSLGDVVAMTLGAVGDAPRLADGSANPMLPPSVVTPLSLALHELATNAVKYGALSVTGGTLRVQGELEPGSVLLICWVERCLQPPKPPSEGLGLRLVRGLISHELGGAFAVEVASNERRYELRVPLRTTP